MVSFSPSHRILNKKLLPSYGVKKLDSNASTYLYLYYLMFMKRLANTSQAAAFRRGSISINTYCIKDVEDNICKEFSHSYRISNSSRARVLNGKSKLTATEDSSSDRNSNFSDAENEQIDDEREEESDIGDYMEVNQQELEERLEKTSMEEEVLETEEEVPETEEEVLETEEEVPETEEEVPETEEEVPETEEEVPETDEEVPETDED